MFKRNYPNSTEKNMKGFPEKSEFWEICVVPDVLRSVLASGVFSGFFIFVLPQLIIYFDLVMSA